MKRIQIYLIMLVVAVLSSCTDKFLDEQNPNNQTQDNFWKTEADLQKGVTACYFNMTERGNGYYGDLFNQWLEIRTPDSWEGPFLMEMLLLIQIR